MEIRIRTHEELRTDRVTIEITGTGAEVTEFAEAKLPSRNLYTDDEVATLQASEAELVSGPLRRRIAELERTLAASVKRETDLEHKVQGYDHDRHTERDRADRERQRASELKDRLSSSEERVKELEDELGHRDRARDELNRRMLVNGQETARKLAQSQDLATRAETDRDLAVKRVKELEADLLRSERSVRARDNLLGAATLKIEQAQKILHNPELEEVLGRIAMRGITVIETAIRDASNTLA